MTNSEDKLIQDKLEPHHDNEGLSSVSEPAIPGKSLLAYIRSHCTILLLSVLIVTAASLTTGRLLLSIASTQKDWIEANLAQALGIGITVGEVQGT